MAVGGLSSRGARSQQDMSREPPGREGGIRAACTPDGLGRGDGGMIYWQELTSKRFVAWDPILYDGSQSEWLRVFCESHLAGPGAAGALESERPCP